MKKRTTNLTAKAKVFNSTRFKPGSQYWINNSTEPKHYSSNITKLRKLWNSIKNYTNGMRVLKLLKLADIQILKILNQTISNG